MKTQFGYFDGLRGYGFEMTIEQALSASHQGQCDEDVAALLKEPEIAAQASKYTPEQLREGLKEAGAWDTEDLADHHANLLRALWLSACDIRENTR